MTMPTMKDEPITPADAKKVGINLEEIAKAREKTQEQALEAEDDADEAVKAPSALEDAPLPKWVKVPTDLVLPKGRKMFALRFKAEWTEDPSKGDRQCILWSLTEADEKIAYRRTRGESQMSLNELSKQMVRAIDGHKVDWAGTTPESNIQLWWDEIGAACRTLIKNTYAKMHTLEAKDLYSFFTDCQAVRTVR